jgi:hypothetical protein
MNEFSYYILRIIHSYDAGISQLRSYAQLRSHARLWSEDITMVVYPNFGRPSRLRSMSQLQTYLPTSVAHHDSGEWVHRLSYHLSCERLCMVGLDDSSILPPGHLVGNRLGGMHDSISVQNLRSHSFACGSSQAMCRVTKEHLACHGLRQTRVSWGTRYPKTLGDQGLQMSAQASLGSMPRGHGTKN